MYRQIPLHINNIPQSQLYHVRSLEYDFFNLFVGCVHDAPTEEGAIAVNTDSFVDVLQFVAPFPVNVHKNLSEIHIWSSAAALHVYLDHVHRVEYCANNCANYGSRGELLGALVQLVRLGIHKSN